MGEMLSLEEQRASLRKMLLRDLVKKRSVEMKIRKQLDELKRVEVCLEKMRVSDEHDDSMVLTVMT